MPGACVSAIISPLTRCPADHGLFSLHFSVHARDFARCCCILALEQAHGSCKTRFVISAGVWGKGALRPLRFGRGDCGTTLASSSPDAVCAPTQAGQAQVRARHSPAEACPATATRRPQSAAARHRARLDAADRGGDGANAGQRASDLFSRRSRRGSGAGRDHDHQSCRRRQSTASMSSTVTTLAIRSSTFKPMPRVSSFPSITAGT